ncbi:NAD-dependent epimerase/dehydratase family protein [Halovenus sp. HT40]|uniref:NAD-dependent epimerase/dehydratase family protein n=1 Tax=Halovenus sp. HT40 TaxID=3126691 RepID=UPI00300F27B5
MDSPTDIDAAEYGVTDKNILVTGGAGFIGSHLVDALVEENSVTVLDNLSNGTVENVNQKAEFAAGDVREQDTVEPLLQAADIVFHQAGLVSVEQSIAEPTESHAINATGTVTVLEAARKTDTRVVSASSAAVYGHPREIPINETARLKPTSPYGIDKVALDQYTRRFGELYGLPTVALRYFNVYGPRQTATDYSGVISIFRDQATAGDPITVHGDGTQTRDFVHVSDVVRANLRAATTDHTAEAFNVGTGTQTSINELAAVVRDVADSESKITHTAQREGDITHSCADIEKSKTTLNFEPEVALADGLRTVIPPTQCRSE